MLINSIEKTKYHINPQHFLHTPFWHVWVKDITGLYTQCNEVMAEANQFQSCQDIVGRRDLDLPIKPEEAERFWNNDRQVIANGYPGIFQEEATLQGSLANFLSIKIPLLCKDNKINALLGFSGELNKKNVETLLLSIGSLNLPLHSFTSHSQLKSRIISGVRLSKREVECLQHMVRGKTARETALALNLSTRTVQFYLENIKNKMNVNSKSELIEKVIDFL